MNEMLRRIAEAVYYAETGGKVMEGRPGDEYLELNGYAATAEDVLKAMREPTRDMYGAGQDARDIESVCGCQSNEMWRAMIDAALVGA